MENKEAIKYLIKPVATSTKPSAEYSKQKEAYDLAIKALEKPPVTPQSGHWVEEKISAGTRKVFCSECGCSPPFEHVNTGDVYSASGYGVINKTKFCPNCGALMKGGAEC